MLSVVDDIKGFAFVNFFFYLCDVNLGSLIRLFNVMNGNSFSFRRNNYDVVTFLFIRRNDKDLQI